MANSRKIMMFFWCLILRFVSLSVCKVKTVWLYKLPKHLLMCLTFHIRVVHFFCVLKKKSIYAKYLCTFKKIFLLGLPNLSAPIRCTQKRYTVQTDLTYHVAVDSFPYVVTFVSLSSRCVFQNAVTTPALSLGCTDL